jgi:hypothetical protein
MSYWDIWSVDLHKQARGVPIGTPGELAINILPTKCTQRHIQKSEIRFRNLKRDFPAAIQVIAVNCAFNSLYTYGNRS